MRTHGGKGSKQRPTDSKKFENNYDAIFRNNTTPATPTEEAQVEETPPLGLHSQRPVMDSKGNYLVKWVGCNNFGKAGEFMNVFGQETLTRPTLPNFDLAGLRLDLIQEEVDELREGLANQDIVEIADALTDILYVVYGAGHAFGIDLDKCYQEVHRSNMTKLDADGNPLFREDGKVMKSDSYEPPNLTKIILGE